jgi:hypothetical protein
MEDSSALRPQDDSQRLADRHYRNVSLIRHSERSEESHIVLLNFYPDV